MKEFGLELVKIFVVTLVVLFGLHMVGMNLVSHIHEEIKIGMREALQDPKVQDAARNLAWKSTDWARETMKGKVNFWESVALNLVQRQYGLTNPALESIEVASQTEEGKTEWVPIPKKAAPTSSAPAKKEEKEKSKSAIHF